MAYADVNGVRLYYEDEGAGWPLLFLHGWGTSGQVWGAQAAGFVHDHRVVTVDWRGCGRSDRPARGNDTATVVADLAGLVELLGLERPVVVGSSVGATFAVELALRHPELVGGAVSVDGPAHSLTLGFDAEEFLGRLAADRAGTVAEWVPGWFAPGASDELARWTVRQILDSGVHIDAHHREAATYDPRGELPGLRVPVHYVHGELSHIPVEISRACAEHAPGAELRVLPGAGHMPHQERPAEFNAVLRELLPR
ncbi:alpha/beta fold hydrolase [Streptomyces caatingaensis]|uniref:Alpha/beta hydrolase n=1 Tax=Streptomyces caatingaensis TaxID=1678637 RepID=A0A0K9XLA3_9ACTN|nr:alpha/beta hydrolase [Streptomyces caatingaensis]KNB54130.1 alpha/beta hydrolase [Streptomyces caatingaensis]